MFDFSYIPQQRDCTVPDVKYTTIRNQCEQYSFCVNGKYIIYLFVVVFEESKCCGKPKCTSITNLNRNTTQQAKYTQSLTRSKVFE